jgi:hypothetical protein
MCAMPTLINTIIAEAPFSVVAAIALPITGVCKGEANSAKNAQLKAVGGIFVRHYLRDVLRRCSCYMSDTFVRGSHISTTNKGVWRFCFWWISFWRSLFIKVSLGHRAKSIPMQTAAASTIAIIAKVVIPLCTLRAIVV